MKGNREKLAQLQLSVRSLQASLDDINLLIDQVYNETPKDASPPELRKTSEIIEKLQSYYRQYHQARKDGNSYYANLNKERIHLLEWVLSERN